MSEQDGGLATAVQRPENDDKEAWKAYWKTQGQLWRTESEIDAQRQKYLAERLTITPDIAHGIYPFKDIKLSRADIEWLLETHENGCGLIDWSDKNQQKHKGLDLRGGNLNNINLSLLPLVGIQGGLDQEWWNKTSMLSFEAAAIHLEGACLDDAHLEGAVLRSAHLEGASLQRSHLEGAYLARAHLERADLYKAHFEGKSMSHQELDFLRQWNKDLSEVLLPADLQSAFFDNESTLRDATFCDEQLIHGFVSIADVRWNGVNLAVIQWFRGKRTKGVALGDELEAKRPKTSKRIVKDNIFRLTEYEKALRANRQFASALQSQGLNDEADHFAYRAQLLQREVWRRQKRFLKYIFSWFLYLIAGYGYRPIRSVIWYLVIISGFAMAYFAFGHLPPVPDALVFSLTSFHGRGFFPGLGNETSLHNPLVVLASLEAVIGLLIEISFIATFTQRFFGR